MLNLIGKALSGMVFDKTAREAMKESGGLASTIQASADARMLIAAVAAATAAARINGGGGSTPLQSPATSSDPNQQIAAAVAAALAVARGSVTPSPQAMRPPMAPPPAPMPRPARPEPSPERDALIQNALRVRSAKRSILDSLSPEQRAKLVELATRLFVPDAPRGA